MDDNGCFVRENPKHGLFGVPAFMETPTSETLGIQTWGKMKEFDKQTGGVVQRARQEKGLKRRWNPVDLV